MEAKELNFQEVAESHAEWFARLPQDEQLEFLKQSHIAVKRMITEWYNERGWDVDAERTALHRWFSLGSHVRNCECTDPSVKAMLENMHEGMLTGTSK